MANKSNPDWYKRFAVVFCHVTRAIVSITLLLLFTSCGLCRDEQDVSSAEETIDLVPLNSSVCELPCWNGIVPGTTHKQEAIEILLELKTENDVVEVKEHEEASESFVFMYVGVTGEMSSDVMQTITLRVHEDTVQVVMIEDVRISLEEIISMLGKPEGVMRLPTWFDDGIMVVYPSKGIIFGVLVQKTGFLGTTLILKPESTLSSAILYPPGTWDATVGAHWVSEKWATANMHPWSGYGDIDKKYPE
ncbi:MAG: hypothetical protein Kow002_05100 [Anaerolineales bacterium]